ncbi:hypothetical protein FNV43_RR00395 [Rhamnella rubrinervis]|uniref:DUF1985 domain-containing protein n=1 Tax=Rhamnella rubrinervis TaxID=2594499 RepID=A0A8K0MRZ2_9ROSA|nr:hypothetical protein FNV43_RR00395 [Rhamnella rubrinervis]
MAFKLPVGPALMQSLSQIDQVTKDQQTGRKDQPFHRPADWQRGPAILQVVNRLVEYDKKYHAHLTNNSNLDRAINFSGGFIHHLLLHQVECEDKYVMEFDFNGIRARFDRKYFAMITGLNCVKFHHNLGLQHFPYDLWTKFFGKRGPMTQGEFSKAFEDLNFYEKEVNIKCYIFYFLETVLFVFDRKDGTKDASQSEFQHTSRLEMQIEEICSELPLSNMPTIPIWDPFTPIDPTERAALFAFIDDPSTTIHLEDYDAIEKSWFQLILTNGSWLGNGYRTILHQEEDDKFSSNAYVSVNNDNKHWLAVKVDIRNWTVTLYNRDNAMSQDSFQCKNAKCLLVLFPYLLMVHGFYELYSELKVEGNSNPEPFDIKCESATNVPQ